MFAGPLPGLSFRLFGFEVTIGVDFLLIAILFAVGARTQPEYLIEWVLVLAAALLLHELGHAFALGRYGIRPAIRLWGLGGLTVYGFTLPPGKSIIVSLAGPGVGIVVGIALRILQPWLADGPLLLQVAVSDAIFVCLAWGVVNLLPISGLDGGNITRELFLVALGSRGRTPGLILVAVASIVIAIAAAFAGILYLALLILVFGFFSPEPYRELWSAVTGSKPRGWGAVAPARPTIAVPAMHRPRRLSWHKAPAPKPRRMAGVDLGTDVRRRFGEIYAEVTGEPPDLDELVSRPEPLLSDVSVLLRRTDDDAAARRLAMETDPLAILVIVARALEAGRLKAIVEVLHDQERRAVNGSGAGERHALLAVQAACHALGRYDLALAAGQALGADAPAEGVLLLARSAARHGDRKRARDELERAVKLGVDDVSEDVLGDLARLGPDEHVAALLARLRREHSR